MSRIDGFAIHHRTAAHDAADAARFAMIYRFARYAAVSERAMKPHLADTLITALADNIESRVGWRNDYDAIDISGYRRKIAIAAYAFHFRSVRIDGQHVKTHPAQLSKDCVRRFLRLARHTGHGKTLAGEKFANAGRKS